MLLNHSSLMLAIAFSGVALSITLIVSWLSSRTENFLVSWAIGALFVVGAAWGYSYYTQFLNTSVGLAAMVSLTVGLTAVYGAGRQFRKKHFPLKRTSVILALLLPPMLVAFPLGYDGIGMIAANINAALLLFATSYEYWAARRQAPLPIAVVIVLYAATGVTFALCAVVIGTTTPLRLVGPPQNWAENLNAVVSIISITGVGAISLALHQSRLALRHRSDARTDPLTGLMNRRALFDKHGHLPAGAAIVLFDLDRFKRVNDDHGHEAGDQVLRGFSDCMRENLRPSDDAARLGGEEFALIMQRSQRDIAIMMADVVRTVFAAEPVMTAGGPVTCTVSAGVAIAAQGGESLDDVLRRADEGLYLAKRDGRNCVRMASDALLLTSASVVRLSPRTSVTAGR